MKTTRKRNYWRIATTATLCVAVCLMSVAPAGAAKCVAEVVSCGGGPSASGSYRVLDTVGQGPVGATAECAGVRVRDGFWVCLPFIAAPVEGAYFGTLTTDGTPLLRWTVSSLYDIVGFNVYRSTSPDGPYECVNAHLLPAESPGSYEDTSVWPGTAFWYEVRAVLVDGTEDAVTGQPVMLETSGSLALMLRPASPNPFTSETTLHFDVPDHVGAVRLAVYNVRGQVVRTLVDAPFGRGRYELTWDGRDEAGQTAAAGVYFARLDVDGRQESQKMMLLR